MAWTVDASGTQTATVGTEHTLDTPTTNGTYVLFVDLSNLANGDVVELRAYNMALAAGSLAQTHKCTRAHAQVNPGCPSPPLVLTQQSKFTLKQTAGTGRSFPWFVARI